MFILSEQLDIAKVVEMIREYQSTNGFDGKQLRLELIDKKFVKMIGNKDKAYDLLLCVSKNDKTYIDLLCDMIPVFKGKTDAFSESRPNGYTSLVNGLYKSLTEVTSEKEEPKKVEPKAEINPKHKYIHQLAKRGFKLVTDKDVIGNSDSLHSTFLAIFRGVYTQRPVKAMGLPDNCNLSNKRLMESLGLKPATADIWDEMVYTKDEDLAFRLFIKEDNTSYTVLLKLPLGVDNFNLQDKNGNMNPDLDAISSVLGNSTFLESPKILNMKNTQSVDCPYDCLKFILVKDLLAFKEDDWLLRDYIQQARGTRTDTKYAAFEELPLGERIVAGVYPGGLQTQKFICTKDISAGFLCGGAGSGKTAMYDSLAVQSLAHCGDAGDGALILLDAKKEWVGVWQELFKQRGIQLYGFDGEVLPPNEMKMETTNKKGETEIVKVPFEVLRCTAGAIFIDGIYNLIQNMLQGSGKKYDNILEFNEDKANFNGLDRIPRITILLDEINTMFGYLKSTAETQRIFREGFIRAKLTRTSGFIWFLGGQDISKSIVPSDERSNYKYSIVGSLDASRYAYYDVDVNKSIVAYEERNGTADKPYPIMSQGVFYAGSKGRTSIVKCMYLPSKERSAALDDLKMDFVGMKQLDALVKYALKEGIFDKYNSLVGAKNNIVYCALKSIGAITQEEFEYYTDRLFNGASDESVDALNNFHDVGVGYDDTANTNSVEDVVVDDVVGNTNDLYALKSQAYSGDPYADIDNSYEDVDDSDKDISSAVKMGAVVGAGAMLGASVLKDIRDKDVEGGNVIPFPKRGIDGGDSYQYGSAIPQSEGVDDTEDYTEDDIVVEGVDDNIDYNEDDVVVENVGEGVVSSKWETPKSVEDIPKNDPIYTEPVKSPNTFMGCEVYSEELDLGNMNPFDARSSKTVFGGIDAFRYMNKVVEKEIKKAYHGLDRINTIHVSDNGLFINDIAFRPFVPKVVIDSLPVDIRGEVAKGNIVEFFDFQMLFKLPNLDTLVIDNVRLAETRVRRELGMKKDMTWDLLYDNFDSLQMLVIGGSKITTPEEAEKYSDTSGGDYEFQERIREAFKFDSDILERVKSPVQKLWRSKPVAILTGAMGGVVGTKVVLGIASMMGAWGILFAGLAGYGAYNTYIKGNGSRSYNNGGGYESYDYGDYGSMGSSKQNKRRRK